MENEKPSLFDWLNLRTDFDYSKNRTLGAVFGVSVFILALSSLAIGALSLAFVLGALLGFGPFAGDQSAAAIRNLGLLIVAVFSAPFLVWRTMVAQRQTNISEQSQITDRINKAVEGLGSIRTDRRQRRRRSGKLAYEAGKNGKADLSKPIFDDITVPNLEVRIGAIYALERIAQDSVRDHTKIMEILCAYIRENSKDNLPPAKPTENRDEYLQQPPTYYPIREDIQTALAVIARRGPTAQSIENLQDPPFRLDLRGAKLDGARLRGSTFGPALLDGSSWRHSELTNSNFSGASIRHCDLSDIEFEGAVFKGAAIDKCKFEGSQLYGCDFSDCHISGCCFDDLPLGGTSFKSADVYDCSFVSTHLAGADFSNATLARLDFHRAFFLDTDFGGSKGCKRRYFDETIGIANGEGKTILPTGFEYPSHWFDIDKFRDHFENEEHLKINAYAVYEAELESWKENMIGKMRKRMD